MTERMAEPGLMFRGEEAEATLDEKVDYQPRQATDLAKEFAKAKSESLSAEDLKKVQQLRWEEHEVSLKRAIQNAKDIGCTYRDFRDTGMTDEQIRKLGIFETLARENSRLEKVVGKKLENDSREANVSRYEVAKKIGTGIAMISGWLYAGPTTMRVIDEESNNTAKMVFGFLGVMVATTITCGIAVIVEDVTQSPAPLWPMSVPFLSNAISYIYEAKYEANRKLSENLSKI